MTLFQGHFIRSALYASAAAGAAHFLLRLIPNDQYAVNLAQSFIAIFALITVGIVIFAHHNRRGHAFTQQQEETLLIGAFGLIWFALLVAYRAWSHDSPDIVAETALAATSTATPTATATAASGAIATKVTPAQVSYHPCATRYGTEKLCIVEEWTYW